jgi:hypothetical protein
MKIYEVIENVKRLKQGCSIDEEQIIADINRVEMNIIRNITDSRENGKRIREEYGGYDIDTDRNKELIAPAPYDTVYQEFCCSQIDLQYEDSERYQNDSIVYNNTFTELKAFWYRTHRQMRKYKYHV